MYCIRGCVLGCEHARVYLCQCIHHLMVTPSRYNSWRPETTSSFLPTKRFETLTIPTLDMHTCNRVYSPPRSRARALSLALTLSPSLPPSLTHSLLPSPTRTLMHKAGLNKRYAICSCERKRENIYSHFVNFL